MILLFCCMLCLKAFLFMKFNFKIFFLILSTADSGFRGQTVQEPTWSNLWSPSQSRLSKRKLWVLLMKTLLAAKLLHGNFLRLEIIFAQVLFELIYKFEKEAFARFTSVTSRGCPLTFLFYANGSFWDCFVDRVSNPSHGFHLHIAWHT